MVTTQRTAKTFKAQIVAGGLLVVIGALMMYGGSEAFARQTGSGFANRDMIQAGAATAGLGLLIYLQARVRAWWHHG